MDFYLQKAKVFALETAKKSQEIANQAAKLSQELAIDVTKKAEELKAYAEELTPTIVDATKGSGPPAPPSEEELRKYGITPELREFVKGLTIKTFREFPHESADDAGTGDNAEQSGKQDLTPWRERHAVLVLLTVKEISDFRYVLCPRRMNEARFWRIYFTLVKSQIAEYEIAASEKAAALAQEDHQASNLDAVHESRFLTQQPSAQPRKDLKTGSKPGEAVAPKSTDHDLDAYLMGPPDSSDEGADGDDDDGFDADFDQLVNSTADSEGEDDSLQTDSNNEGKKGKQPKVSAAKPVAASEVSSDGELVEIPDNESEPASRMPGGDKTS